jgi:hypothetical protein
MEPAPEGKPWVDVTDPIDSLPEPQRTNAKRIRALVTSLRKVRPPSKGGDLFVGHVNPKGEARIQMFCREGLYEAKTVEIMVSERSMTYDDVAERLAREWAAMQYGMFLKTFAPDLYADDGSPVEVTEMKTVRSLRMM